MAPRKDSRPRLTAPWLAYTDLLSSTLLILSVVVVASVLAKLTNEKPPVIRLSDAQDFRFKRGSFQISYAFRQKLINEELKEIERAIQCYAIDTVEVIGHTDRLPNSGLSNLDRFSTSTKLAQSFPKVKAGSNADLGLLRALSVQKLLEENIGQEDPDLVFRSYSAGSLIDPPQVSTRESLPQEKRRIEIRLTRNKEQSALNKC